MNKIKKEKADKIYLSICLSVFNIDNNLKIKIKGFKNKNKRIIMFTLLKI